jgi:S1-C subfamily serine protease
MSEIDPKSRDLTPPQAQLPAPPPPPPGWYPPPVYGAPPAPHSAGRWIAVVTIVATILAAGGGLGIGLTMARYLHPSAPATQSATVQPTAQPSSSTAPIVAATPSTSKNGTLNVAQVTAKVAPAIVDINTVVDTGSGTGAAAGTGMILTPSGEVLTNNHVVDGSISISVTIAGKIGSYTAHVIGVSPGSDVALIQIEGVSGLPTVTLADSSAVKVGDQIVAMGNALGAGGAPSVTQGQVTATDQTITASEGNGNSETLNGMIESDATISPGDSGGAVVNSAGQVIGMITAGAAQGFRSNTSSVGYAIPTNTALSVVNQVRSGQAGADVLIGPVGYMGVTVRDLDSQLAGQYGLKLNAGALVWSVQAGGPAEQAGITRLSVITDIGGTSIDSTVSLGKTIHAYKPGASVSVTWIDQGGASHTKSVTLTTGPNV